MHSRIFDYIDPVIFNIFGIPIRWYGLAYALGIFLGYMMFKHNAKKICNLKLHKNFYDDLIFYILIGIIIGGRLGYVLLYNLQHYAAHPIDIFKIYQGGMSFHGGLIGCILSCYILSKKHQIKFLQLSDIIATVAPIGLFFGRIANFINAEIFGRPTDKPWGVIFPNSDGILRHPSQLYEAFAEGILLLFILNLWLRVQYKSNHPTIAKKTGKNKQIDGLISCMFLIFYSIFRFIIEYFREPDSHLNITIIEAFGTNLCALSRGQILSIQMFAIGLISLIFIIYRTRYHDGSTN